MGGGTSRGVPNLQNRTVGEPTLSPGGEWFGRTGWHQLAKAARCFTLKRSRVVGDGGLTWGCVSHHPAFLDGWQGDLLGRPPIVCGQSQEAAGRGA